MQYVNNLIGYSNKYIYKQLIIVDIHIDMMYINLFFSVLTIVEMLQPLLSKILRSHSHICYVFQLYYDLKHIYLYECEHQLLYLLNLKST